MRVLVTGASGFLGVGVTRALCRAGHDVLGLFRSPAKEPAVRAAGAAPIVADLSSPAALERARDVDVIVHCAQTDLYDRHLTKRSVQKAAALDREWVTGLLAAGAGRASSFVYPSGGWVYGETLRAVDENAPLRPFAAAAYKPVHERLALQEGKRLGYRSVMILRSGALYGPGGGFAQYVVEPMVRGRRCRTAWVGSGRHFVSYIHVDDLGSAFVKAIELQPGFVTLNVTDDEPVQIREAIGFLARELGVEPPSGIPRPIFWLLRGVATQALTQSSRMSNKAAKATLGWAPSFPTYREGFVDLVRHVRQQRGSRSVHSFVGRNRE
jgi:nucleoside-diphosphate-sugar epimerase